MPSEHTQHRQSSHAVDETISVLLVEDNDGDARLFKHHINTDRSAAFPAATVTHVKTLDAALAELENSTCDIVLLDLGLPRSSGVDTLESFNKEMLERTEMDMIPVVVLTGLEDDQTAIEAIERGAQDYLIKDDVNRKILNRTIRYAIERHTQEQKLRQEKERFEKFANVVSHDLRNPLTVAKGHVETIDHDDLDPVERNLDRMEEIIEDVLTLARTGQESTELTTVHLQSVAQQSWQQVPTEQASMSVADNIDFRADPQRCEQLFENLFRNSIEHAGESVSVRVASTDDGFLVEDDGSGISASERDDVFEPGYTTDRDGTGFGLNIVKAIAEAHGWHVDITDGSMGGARFTISNVEFA
jgi:signal transduction histidine kinase